MAIGEEDGGTDRPVMALQGEQFLAAVKVPDLGRAVIARRHQAFALGRKAHRGHRLPVPPQIDQRLAGRRIPDPEREIARAVAKNWPSGETASGRFRQQPDPPSGRSRRNLPLSASQTPAEV